jgi:hypothetical protein
MLSGVEIGGERLTMLSGVEIGGERKRETM